jgi:hypothetical protein
MTFLSHNKLNMYLETINSFLKKKQEALEK